MKARPLSSSLETIKNVSGDDGEEAKEGRVREKLQDAICLALARELGMERRVADLRSFASFGGLQNFAKELVRSLSSGAKGHDDRRSVFTQNLKPFCGVFDISFDESLLLYLKDICESTNVSILTIQESASGKFAEICYTPFTTTKILVSQKDILPRNGFPFAYCIDSG